MNNQIKIVQEQGAFIGYLLQDGNVAYKTDLCPTANTASRLISEYIALSNTGSRPSVSIQQIENVPQAPTPVNVSPNPPMPVPRPSGGGGCGCRRG